jgi:hypothetical protein
VDTSPAAVVRPWHCVSGRDVPLPGGLHQPGCSLVDAWEGNAEVEAFLRALLDDPAELVVHAPEESVELPYPGRVGEVGGLEPLDATGGHCPLPRGGPTVADLATEVASLVESRP